MGDHVGAIAARIAHDFNSLLAPVLGNVILLEEDTPPQLRQRVTGIREATDAARGFAQRLMTIDPKRKFALEPADLGQVVRNFLPTVRAAMRAEIAIEDFHTTAVDSVSVNRKQIEHAILELALNAQDAMPSGGKLSIALDTIESEGGTGRVPAGRWVRLCVRDNGRGMEPSLIEHAFEPFVTTKVPSCGTGLGLSAVYAIICQHGGMIDVESQPGKGSTFSIYLPSNGVLAAKCTHVPATHAADSHAPAPETTLLLVEDNAMVRRSIEHTLRSMGYRVLAVESGERCVEMVLDLGVRVDLLITDVVMPEMSGKELVLRVHALRPGLPVLFMSGYDMSTLASRKQSMAVEHFLQKPFDSRDLLQAVRAAFGAGPPSLDFGKKG
jgi:two-component system, cell cycle sensor histidine kinase and response regulator CckA